MKINKFKHFLLRLFYDLQLPFAFNIDKQRYIKHSFKNNKIGTLENLKAQIIFEYHGIEKGFTYLNLRNGFGGSRINRLIYLLKYYLKMVQKNDKLYYIAWTCLNYYFEFHNKLKFDNFEYSKNFSNFLALDKPLENQSQGGGAHFISKIEFDKSQDVSFGNLIKLRKSIRNFGLKKINRDLLVNSILMANNSPSVCNRAPWNVYVISDSIKISLILSIQNGLKGEGNNISHLILITCDLSRYSNYHERNQAFIDGGLFSMSLLYSFTYNRIANCPLNANLSINSEKEVRKILNIPDSQVLIMFIATGSYNDENKVTNSSKENIDEKIIFH